MSILVLIIPIVMIVCGGLMRFRPQKKINRFIGYRTKASMKNLSNWDFAQQYCGKLWMKGGAGMLLISVLFLVLFPGLRKNLGLNLLLVIVQTVLLCLTALPVEKALKNREGDD